MGIAPGWEVGGGGARVVGFAGSALETGGSGLGTSALDIGGIEDGGIG